MLARVFVWQVAMSEIERVIELVESFEQGDTALLEMKFAFEEEGPCRDFFARALDCFLVDDVISPKNGPNGYICGVREQVQLDADAMRELCHSYREIAYQYDGRPLPWAVKIRR